MTVMELPVEVIQMIFNLTGDNDTLNLRLVCRYFQAIATERAFRTIFVRASSQDSNKTISSVDPACLKYVRTMQINADYTFLDTYDHLSRLQPASNVDRDLAAVRRLLRNHRLLAFGACNYIRENLQHIHQLQKLRAIKIKYSSRVAAHDSSWREANTEYQTSIMKIVLLALAANMPHLSSLNSLVVEDLALVNFAEIFDQNRICRTVLGNLHLLDFNILYCQREIDDDLNRARLQHHALIVLNPARSIRKSLAPIQQYLTDFCFVSPSLRTRFPPAFASSRLRFPHLRSLKLNGWVLAAESDLNWILGQGEKLKSLDLRECCIPRTWYTAPQRRIVVDQRQIYRWSHFFERVRFEMSELECFAFEGYGTEGRIVADLPVNHRDQPYMVNDLYRRNIPNALNRAHTDPLLYQRDADALSELLDVCKARKASL